MLRDQHPAVLQQPAAQNILAYIGLQRERLHPGQLAELLPAFQNGRDQRATHAGNGNTVRFPRLQHLQPVSAPYGDLRTESCFRYTPKRRFIGSRVYFSGNRRRCTAALHSGNRQQGMI